jgi:hypothetical protein
LVSKVYCKVDAQYASIEVGDLLTSSPTPGCAMKAEDPFKDDKKVAGVISGAGGYRPGIVLDRSSDL